MDSHNVNLLERDTLCTEWDLVCQKFRNAYARRNAKLIQPEQRKTFSEFEEVLIIEMYKNWLSYKEIAERLNVGEECIKNKIKYMIKNGLIERRK